MSEENPKYPKLLLDLLTTAKKNSVNFYPKMCDRDFFGACLLFATGPEYSNITVSEFIMQALKYYIAEGLFGEEKERFKMAMVEIDQLLKKDQDEDVKSLLNEIYREI